MQVPPLQKQRDSAAGYATDFPPVLYQLATQLGQLPGGMGRFPRVIANAGGMNPWACAEKAREALRHAGVSRRFAVVSGDDLMPQLDELLAAGYPLANLDTG